MLALIIFSLVLNFDGQEALPSNGQHATRGPRHDSLIHYRDTNMILYMPYDFAPLE